MYLLHCTVKEKEVKKQTRQLEQRMIEGGASDAILYLEDGQCHVAYHCTMYISACKQYPHTYTCTCTCTCIIARSLYMYIESMTIAALVNIYVYN